MSIVHLLGNGDSAQIFNNVEREPKDKVLICNVPPFTVRKVFACIMVDFKMMAALSEGSVNLNAYDWVLGTRPQRYMEMFPSFYLQYAPRIKDFYTTVPPYAGSATDFNCGHMAAHYACSKLKCSELHMYGFDSIFDYSLRSSSDLFLESDRGQMNNHRLINIWRPIWEGIFNEHPQVKFVLHHTHNNAKIAFPDNVEVRTP